jgi:hypothetical protein
VQSPLQSDRVDRQRDEYHRDRQSINGTLQKKWFDFRIGVECRCACCRSPLSSGNWTYLAWGIIPQVKSPEAKCLARDRGGQGGAGRGRSSPPTGGPWCMGTWSRLCSGSPPRLESSESATGKRSRSTRARACAGVAGCARWVQGARSGRRPEKPGTLGNCHHAADRRTGGRPECTTPQPRAVVTVPRCDDSRAARSSRTAVAAKSRRPHRARTCRRSAAIGRAVLRHPAHVHLGGTQPRLPRQVGREILRHQPRDARPALWPVDGRRRGATCAPRGRRRVYCGRRSTPRGRAATRNLSRNLAHRHRKCATQQAEGGDSNFERTKSAPNPRTAQLRGLLNTTRRSWSREAIPKRPERTRLDPQKRERFPLPADLARNARRGT